MLAADAAGAAIGGAAEPVSDKLASVTPSVQASAALVGGLACAWSRADGSPGYAVVDIFPADDVPQEQTSPAGQISCGADFLCGQWTTIGEMVIRAAVSRPNTGADPTEAEIADIRGRTDPMIAAVSALPAGELSGVPADRSADFWDVTDCASVRDAVVDAMGMAKPQEGYPSDNLPAGPLWETLVASGAANYCAWYDMSGGQTLMSEVILQPGIGRPTDAQLTAASAAAITIPGADEAWSAPSGADNDWIIAVSGSNRLTVGGTAGQDVAAAVLAVLAGK